MPVFKGYDATWADAVGGILRGEQRINQFLPDHAYIKELPHIEELMANDTRHIMLLTLEEVRGILDDLTGKADDFFSYKLGAGNTKDIWQGKNSLANFTTSLNEAKQLEFNLKGIGIKAIACKYGAETYIKITGYPSLRRILNGTRYKANNPQLLELGIGWRGVAYSIVKGIKFCVYFSLAFRAIELIFKHEYTLVDFFGDVIMDTAKTLVSTVVAVATGGLIALYCPFIILTTIFVIALGITLNTTLNTLDAKYDWSVKLKNNLRDAFQQEQRIRKWNNSHMGSEMTLFYNLHN